MQKKLFQFFNFWLSITEVKKLGRRDICSILPHYFGNTLSLSKSLYLSHTNTNTQSHTHTLKSHIFFCYTNRPTQTLSQVFLFLSFTLNFSHTLTPAPTHTLTHSHTLILTHTLPLSPLLIHPNTTPSPPPSPLRWWS